MRAIIANDPGKTGAIAILWNESEYEVHDMPQIGGDYDVVAMADLFRTVAVDPRAKTPPVMLIERQGHIMGDAVSSAVSLADCVGMLKMAAAVYGFRLQFVEAKDWQSAMYKGEPRAERVKIEYPLEHKPKDGRCRCDGCKAQKRATAKRRDEGKEIGLRVARRLFPLAPLARKMDEGRAAALLLGEYGRRMLNGGAS